MTAEAILADLLACGITPALTPDGAGIVVPAGRLTGEQRAAVRDHKPELIERIREAARLTEALLAATMRACDAHGDGEQAREQMRQDVLATPPHLRADLLDHFKQTYGGAADAAD
ncbi:hypothetical protein [Alicycliphilus denitrificans]|uniref:TubC N-terminal docking domain-containing protein n=1 Tax=Alicycliphilus denitrificans (strain DSM 14773 / CIP 107495 / K601) TaxID=596154 RepID=F4G3M1_ALIDK|nr:hypothetical protein [Alicycliphilus denitrificans]AEB82849.1 hypothetical protein Alide2_0427 [Alicycliphilus denitrificans K601]